MVVLYITLIDLIGIVLLYNICTYILVLNVNIFSVIIVVFTNLSKYYNGHFLKIKHAIVLNLKKVAGI